MLMLFYTLMIKHFNSIYIKWLQIEEEGKHLHFI